MGPKKLSKFGCPASLIKQRQPALPLASYHAALVFTLCPPCVSVFPLLVGAVAASFRRRHCHSTSTGRKLHRSNSGHIHLRKTMSVRSWHCQSMKSLSRSTPEVRMRRSRGGSEAVNIWSVRVFAVIVSGSRYRTGCCCSEGVDGCCGGGFGERKISGLRGCVVLLRGSSE